MISRLLRLLAFAAWLGLVAERPALLYGATITLDPVADTSILSAFPTYNFGGGTTLTAGGRPKGGESRALLLFDVHGSLPAGAIIQSASLRLTVVGTPSGAINSVFDLTTLTSSWAEGTGADRGGTPATSGEATWNNPFGTSGAPWTTPGGDFSSSVSAFVSVLGNGSYTFSSNPSLVSNVQGWLNNPSSNFGWILRSESELTARTIRRFGSRADLVNTPVLTIQYAVPEPSACLLLALGFGSLICKYRNTKRHQRSAS